MSALTQSDPVPALLARVRSELGASFDASRPIRISRAPGRLDVMGGIADYTGSLVCPLALDRAAAVALQPRDDRLVQVFSFNLLDEHKPFTMGISLDALATADIATLRSEFSEPSRTWAAYLLGGLALLHHLGELDLRAPLTHGLNLALLSTIPMGAGISSSAAIEVASLLNLIDHFQLRDRFDPISLARLAQRVENEIVGAPCGIMDQVATCMAPAGQLLRLRCQPYDLLPPLPIPTGMKLLGIDSGVRHQVGGVRYSQTRCAAFMAHRMILEKMRDFGRAAQRPLEGDPMRGYLANLNPDDYKRFFRAFLPESIKGGEFLLRFGGTIDPVTTVSPDTHYAVLGGADHHVLEATRIERFVQQFELAASMNPTDPARGIELDKAGHLMYASHLSYTNDAKLGSPECDQLVALIRQHERQGLYGARITGGGCGGTIALLCEDNTRTHVAIDTVLNAYEKLTGLKPQRFDGSSDGAWATGTVLV